MLFRSAERVVRNRYQGGVVNYAELASTESTSLSAQSQLLSVQAERLNNYVTLLAAVGGPGGSGRDGRRLPASRRTA